MPRVPTEFQVWNQNLLASDFDVEFGDRAEKLRPIEIAGARNGSFSGKLMVGSAGPIRGLTVTAADLKGPGGIIPAANVTIRYGTPWGDDSMVEYPSPHSGRASLLAIAVGGAAGRHPGPQEGTFGRQGPQPATHGAWRGGVGVGNREGAQRRQGRPS